MTIIGVLVFFLSNSIDIADPKQTSLLLHPQAFLFLHLTLEGSRVLRIVPKWLYKLITIFGQKRGQLAQFRGG